MVAETRSEAIQHLCIEKAILIAAPIEIAFEAMLDELGPESTLPDGTAMPMILEAYPGGRWYRDLGNHAGHFWGHVQVIKPPNLLEISGPLFMSFPCANHIQYRFAADGIGTRLTLMHRGFGEVPEEYLNRIGVGWAHGLQVIKAIAEARFPGK